MKLFELAYGCRLYAQLTSYDASLDRLRALGPGFDPCDAGHRAVLFKWLNDWGCRQFAKEHHATTASTALERWARVWLDKLPPLEAHLTGFSPAEIRVCTAAYEALRDCQASVKQRADGATIHVTYGPTGAAKILFALRPNAFAPWDDPIRVANRWSADGASFRQYLSGLTDQLRALCSEAQVPVEELPALVGRPKSSPPKLVDEYNWVTLTKGCLPPSAEEVTRWAAWAANASSPDREG